MADKAIPAPATEWIARTGLGARAFVYLAVAWLLALGAVGARPDDGAGQFDYRGKTIALAPGFGEAEGAAIVQWLRGRLPVGAFAV